VVAGRLALWVPDDDPIERLPQMCLTLAMLTLANAKAGGSSVSDMSRKFVAIQLVG
jgi:hypothetical protein